jgi:GNAT superfamily N-acetyltransferase
MEPAQTFVVRPGTPELVICARWRSQAFSVLETKIDEEIASLERFTSDQTHQVALIAKRNDVPLGTCLLVQSEIDPNHDVSPWLAGLFVASEYRRQGIGALLVRAIEEQAKLRGFSRLYLYTISAKGFYERLGWLAVDSTTWKGFETAFMTRDLA